MKRKLNISDYLVHLTLMALCLGYLIIYQLTIHAISFSFEEFGTTTPINNVTCRIGTQIFTTTNGMIIFTNCDELNNKDMVFSSSPDYNPLTYRISNSCGIQSVIVYLENVKTMPTGKDKSIKVNANSTAIITLSESHSIGTTDNSITRTFMLGKDSFSRIFFGKMGTVTIKITDITEDTQIDVVLDSSVIGLFGRLKSLFGIH